jgi:hypothetical protein
MVCTMVAGPGRTTRIDKGGTRGWDPRTDEMIVEIHH